MTHESVPDAAALEGPVTLRAYDVPVPRDPHAVNGPLSALPSPVARALAFVAIIVAGIAGAVIGFALVDVQSDDAGDVARGIGLLIGGVVFAAGTSVVAVLVLRAVGEWRDIGDRR